MSDKPKQDKRISFQSQELVMFQMQGTKNQNENDDEILLNGENRKKVSISRKQHKSVLYTDMDFGQTFKNLRSLDLYSNLYTTELERNFDRIDNKIIGFKERFIKIKKRIEKKNSIINKQKENNSEKNINSLNEIDNLKDNLENLYNFYYLKNINNEEEKLKKMVKDITYKEIEEKKKNKIIEIELYSEKYNIEKELEKKLKKKYEELLKYYIELNNAIGIETLSPRFQCPYQIYKFCLKVKLDIEKNTKIKNHSTMKNEFDEIMEGFKDIKKKLEDKQNSTFGKENLFGQQEIEYINRIISYYDKYFISLSIMEETLSYIQKINLLESELRNINNINFDNKIAQLEQVLNNNDKVIKEVKDKLKGKFGKMITSI